MGDARQKLVVLVGIWLLYVGNTVERLLGATWLGAAMPSAAPAIRLRVPIELPGAGVLCASAAAVPVDAPCRKLQAERRLLLGVALDLESASAADLEALPGIGPRLAQRIAASRPLPSVLALARVRGIGPKKAQALAPLVGLDARRLPDICSTGSWPTTSSGCDKQR